MNDKVVYLHRRKLDNKVFYVGIGYEKRAYDFVGRNKFWHNYVKKYGKPLVEIYKDNLTKKEASKIEVNLIKKYGRRSRGKGHLVNLSSGGEMGTIGVNEKRVICLKKGVVYKSISEYCLNTKQLQPVISDFLNRKEYSNNKYYKDYYVRLVIDNKIQWIPYFDGNFKRKDDTFSISSDEYYNKNERKVINIKDRLNKLSYVEEALLYLSLETSINVLSKKYNLGYYKLYNKINKIKRKFIKNEDVKEYNNSNLSLEIKEKILKDYNNLSIIETYTSKTKTCTQCRIEKTFSHFHKSKNRKYGITSKCKKCANRNRRLYNINKNI
ncbi:MAG: hypothetical protein GY820_09600 [Gammaproteobacteria bacterium]|nr:hypothetical protein [Gammaproteobacteria bacterium]